MTKYEVRILSLSLSFPTLIPLFLYSLIALLPYSQQIHRMTQTHNLESHPMITTPCHSHCLLSYCLLSIANCQLHFLIPLFPYSLISFFSLNLPPRHTNLRHLLREPGEQKVKQREDQQRYQAIAQ